MNNCLFLKELNNLINDIRASGMSVRGCDDQQLVELEKKYGLLPESYKLFLSLMGIEAGDFIIGTSILFSEIDDINEGVIALMETDDIIPPENMFAFLLHQGYSSLFFVDRFQKDPIVYCYTEGESIKETTCTFSNFILGEIESYKEYRSK
ncbi:SMI1/KNR4 family protein [Xenorhabdus anantnagensis]|uniref:SMI1/KNR4 family protein n=1 Tax=Xenorhabdus anantnagensis TaxID=3025875 RepID=A0ABT5LR30_9GAMM|nr:SMI1/KNR4 family protein [Xenorhabdus anantnagensis]MDC9596253.1 SMI1/KNR4 family protein [Xenorhabdus anantnagensis]